jgi:hypothetical protein
MKFLLHRRPTEGPLPAAWVFRPLWTRKSIRFIRRQRDHFRCSPIAVINCFKWLGYPITNQDLFEISRLCKTDQTGTNWVPFRRCVNILCDKFGVPRRFIKSTGGWGIRALEKHLQTGNAVIASVKWVNGKTKGDWHSALFYWGDLTGDLFLSANLSYHETTGAISRAQLKSHISCFDSMLVVDRRALLCAMGT